MNRIRLNAGVAHELETPYPGGNLFSLASGGAVYVRDPWGRVGMDQLNGGQLAEVTARDWQLILPYLEENERLFGVKIQDLLDFNSREMQPGRVYRKVQAAQLQATPLHG